MIYFQTKAITVSNSDVRTPCVASDFTSCLRSVNDVTSIRLEKPFQNLNSREVEKYPIITETRSLTCRLEHRCESGTFGLSCIAQI